MSIAFASEFLALERAALDALGRTVDWHARVVFAMIAVKIAVRAEATP